MRRLFFTALLTGALGALPMAVNPGPGSIIYRGLAAVIVGGVVVAMIFSLLLLPSLMRLMTGWRTPVAQATRSLKSGDVPRAA